jgi:hypothetical protein
MNSIVKVRTVRVIGPDLKTSITLLFYAVRSEKYRAKGH